MENSLNQEVGCKSPYLKKLQGVDLVLTIQEGFTADWAAKAGVPPGKKSLAATQAPTDRGKPSTPFVNLCLEGLKSGVGIEGSYGTVLLSNPVGASLVSFEGLVKEVATVFGLHGRPYTVKNPGVTLNAATDISKLAGTTLTVVPATAEDAAAQTPSIDGSACRFVNVKLDGKMGTVLLENPAGCPLFSSAEEMQRKIGAIYSTSKKLSSDEKKMQPVKFESLDGLHGKTVYLL